MGQVNVNTNILGSVVTSGLLRPPFYSDLLTWHKTITDNDFAESINNLPARFLPRVADFNGTDDCVDTTMDLSNATSFDLTFRCYRGSSGITTSCMQSDDNSNRAGILWFTDNNVYAIISNVTSSFGSISFNQTGWFTLRMVYDGSGVTDADKIKLYIDNIQQSLSYTGVIPSSLDNIVNKFNIGCGFAGNVLFTTGLISYVSVSKDGGAASQYYPQGHGDYEYDVSGNGNHGTWSGTGSRYGYNKNGSTYLNTQGYSLWQKESNPDIQVPFDIDGDPLSLTPGTDIPTGYTHSYDNASGGSNWNMADALIDFDPDDTLDSNLDNFDRSNTTIYSADARSGVDYDAGNPYRFHINNLDPRIYLPWRNVGYRGKMFSKIILGEYEELRYIREILNYSTDYTDGDEFRIMRYCGYSLIIQYDENGDYITDGDGYVLLRDEYLWQPWYSWGDG
jgi:hypothetical protein